MKIKKAVFPVAGFGTRFLPATKATPKEMLPVVDKPIIQYAVEEAAAAGIEEFIFITHHAKRAIDDHFDENHELVDALSKNNKTEFLKKIQNIGGKQAKFTFIRQGEPKGLGHAIGCAKHVIENNESFAVILADDLMKTEGKNVLEQMIEVASYLNHLLQNIFSLCLHQIICQYHCKTLIVFNNMLGTSYSVTKAFRLTLSYEGKFCLLAAYILNLF